MARNTTANIDIVSKTDKDGIDIIIKPGTINESVHIPVLLSQSGLQECVYNDFILEKVQMSRSWQAVESTTAAWTHRFMQGYIPSIWKGCACPLY